MTTSRFGRTNRRRFIATSAIGGAAILTAGQLLPAGQQASAPAVLAQDSSSDVPMYRGNAARTGEMPGPGPDDANGVEVIWQYTSGFSMNFSPAVVGGVVFVGSGDNNFYAFDAEDGTEKWRIEIGLTASPAVANGVVFVQSREGFVYAISAEDGSVLWRSQTGNRAVSSPAVVNGVVYVCDGHGGVIALDLDKGRELWRFSTEGDFESDPAVVDGVVYFGSSGNLYALAADGGGELWRFTHGGSIPSCPAVMNGLVYIASEPNLYAINAADGVERWRNAIGAAMSDSSPTVFSGNVYIGNADGNLYAFNADDGGELWNLSTGVQITSSPAVVDSTVYVGTNGYLCAVDAADGRERWRFAVDYSIYSGPAVANGVVYIGTVNSVVVASDGGTFYAIGARIPAFGAGGTARVIESTSLRGGPAPTAVERAELEPDTEVTITGESESAGDVTWWPVAVDATGEQGWVEASTLEPLTSGPMSNATPT